MAAPLRRALLASLLLLLLQLAAGAQQLFTSIVAGQNTNPDIIATGMYTSDPALSVMLPSIPNGGFVLGVAVDKSSGVIYFTVFNNALHASTVVAATPVAGGGYTLTTIAGNYLGSATNDGVGTAASFQELCSIDVDGSGNVYVADILAGNVRKLTPGAGGYTVSTILTGFSQYFYSALAVLPNGTLYYADGGDSIVYEAIETGGTYTATAIAGSATCFPLYSNPCYDYDGVGDAARFFNPAGVAVNSVTGAVYVMDSNNRKVKELTQSGGIWTVTTIAGLHYGSSSCTSDCVDGASPQAPVPCLFAFTHARLL